MVILLNSALVATWLLSFSAMMLFLLKCKMQTNSFLETLTLQSENIRFRKLKVLIMEFPLLLTDLDPTSLLFTLQLSSKYLVFLSTFVVYTLCLPSDCFSCCTSGRNSNINCYPQSCNLSHLISLHVIATSIPGSHWNVCTLKKSLF